LVVPREINYKAQQYGSMATKAKSVFVTNLDNVQRSVTALLRPFGFKKAGRTYNRMFDSGIVHVVSFQMGEYPIGDYVVPGLRESFYGKFAVNLGVYLPTVFEIEGQPRPGRTYHDYHCEIRERLGALANGGQDVWWDLSEPVEVTSAYVADVLVRIGLPFLSQFESYDAVLTYFKLFHELPFHNEGRSALAAAIISYHLGRRSDAEDFFEAAIDYAKDHPGFREHVKELRQRCFNDGT
jgi:hypothetical protein